MLSVIQRNNLVFCYFFLVAQNALWLSLECKITSQQAKLVAKKDGQCGKCGLQVRQMFGRERQGLPPAPLLTGSQFYRTGPLTYRNVLLRARCQNASWNSINISGYMITSLVFKVNRTSTVEKLPKHVSVSIFGEVILLKKNNKKSAQWTEHWLCCRHCVKHFMYILNSNSSSILC